MRQLHLGALCVGIYKWAQNDFYDKRANSVAVSEANLLRTIVIKISTPMLKHECCSLANCQENLISHKGLAREEFLHLLSIKVISIVFWQHYHNIALQSQSPHCP